MAWAGVAAAVIVAGWLLASRSWHSGFVTTAKIQATHSTSALKPASPPMRVKRSDGSLEQRAPRRRPDQVVSRSPAETANDFIALAGTLYPMGEGMVVRVELPRSAPALVGLPIAGGDISSTVTADVVLGQDGVARAIRFVQPEEVNAARPNFHFQQN